MKVEKLLKDQTRKVAAESLPVRREPGWCGSRRRNDYGQPFASSRVSERPGRQGVLVASGR